MASSDTVPSELGGEAALGHWTEAEILEATSTGEMGEPPAITAAVRFMAEVMVSKCEYHRAILAAVVRSAIRKRVIEARFDELIEPELQEALGCTACIVKKEHEVESEAPIDYAKVDKRFCARCKCAVAYNHRCVPKLQYSLAEAK